MEDKRSKMPKIKYPMSINGTQCIGPCYKPGKVVLHPVTLNWISNKHDPFCPINQNEDNETAQQCAKITSNDSKTQTENFDYETLLPFIDLTPQRFLKLYYSIYSLDETFSWLSEHTYLPLDTKIRVMDNSMAAYGKNLDITNMLLINFLIEIINTKWNNNIYKNISQYLSIDSEEKKIIFINDPIKNNEYQNEKKNFIFNKMLSYENVNVFLNKIIKNKMNFKLNDLQTQLMDYLIEKIKLTEKIN